MDLLPFYEELSHACTKIGGLGEFVLMRVYQTCIEMCADRGYTDIEELCTPQESIRNSEPCIRAVRMDNSVFYIQFAPEPRINVRILRRIQSESKETTHILLVSTHGGTSFCKHLPKNISIITYAQLFINIYRHEHVPKHTVVQKQDYEHIRDLEDHNIPRLMFTDPVALYLGLAIGDIVRIHRNSLHSSDYFRIVS